MRALHDLTATELLAAYAARTLSPVEVTRNVLQHIAAWEPHLHATYALDAEAALVQAEASQARWLKGTPQGPLDGVPTTIKENIATKGVAMPIGCAASVLTPAERDARPVLGLPPVWYKSSPYRSRAVIDPRGVLAEFGTVLEDSVAIQVWDSTAEVRYLVIPERPAGTEALSEDELAALVTRDGMIGTARR